MTAASVAERGALRSLEFVRAAVRRLPPERRAWLSRRCKPAWDRAMARVARPELRHEEQAVRAAIAAEPADPALWFRLGQVLAARERNGRATDAFVTAAERGARLTTVTITLLTRPGLHRRAGDERYMNRMRRIVDDDPESVHKELCVGAFMLDQGRVETGRAMLRRAYAAQLSEIAEHADIDTAPGRSISGPDFMILGPPKTGSTSLYAFLADHPLVIPTPRKELQFWRHRYGRSADVFDAYFPEQLPTGFITGEASTNTLTNPGAAQEIADRYPALKVIVLRRDPVERAYSEYQMWRRDLAAQGDFDSATSFQLRRIGEAPPLEPADLAGLPDFFLAKSCILPYLRVWIDALGPARVMVVESAALASQRQTTVDGIHDFLGLPRRSVSGQEDRNVFDYDPIPRTTAERLAAWFAPHEVALDAFLAMHPNVIRESR